MTEPRCCMLIMASTIVCWSCFNGAEGQSNEDAEMGSDADRSSSAEADASTGAETGIDAGARTGDAEAAESDAADSEAIGVRPVDSETDDIGVDDGETADSGSGAEEPEGGDSGLVGASTEPLIDVAVVLNPYDGVDWETWGQYKANFQAHTTNSDGDDPPEVVIEQYHSKLYDVLAITDHDYATWPWTDYGVDPASLGMLAVKGDEYSQSHHVNALYDFTETVSDMETGVAHVDEQGGLSQINHPGSYAYSNETYLDYYRQYASCIWLEVFNSGDRYPDDRLRWDEINEILFREQGRLVWGSSNDDKHSVVELYRNFQFMLAPELTEDAMRTAQTTGAFYFAYEPAGSGDAKVPRVVSVGVDNDAKTITVDATGYDAIHWIGPGSDVVAEGAVFNFSDYASKARVRDILDVVAGYARSPFVRFVLKGPLGDSYSQPFGFECTPTDT